MIRNLKDLSPRLRRIPSLAALLFVVCVLLVFNLSNWRILRDLQISKEKDLAKRLRSVAEMIVRALSYPSPPAILMESGTFATEEQSEKLRDFAETHSYDELIKRLSELQTRSGLSQVTIITTSGLVVADASHRSSPGDPYYTIDNEYIERAKRGEDALRPLYRHGNEWFQRIYLRLLDEQQNIAGLLQASISPDYFDEMKKLRTSVLRVWVLSSMLLILIGIWLYRVFGYLVRLERSAMQSARVEAMGALASGVAHELRNPLAIIRALSEEIASEQAPHSRSAQNANDIVSETQRLGELVTHFLSLSRAPQESESGSVDLGQEVEKVIQLLRKGASGNLVLESDLPSGPVLVRANERALRQLLLNLLINARESLPPEGGNIVVSLRSKRNQAELRIMDSGGGIAPKSLARIFEPFYTTKASGTGLGLAITKGICENLGGDIQINSTEGKGTEVIVLLPTAGDSAL